MDIRFTYLGVNLKTWNFDFVKLGIKKKYTKYNVPKTPIPIIINF